jgi:Trk K+ transport system NAD-binding subunit
MTGHIILCGLGKIGYSILELLKTLEEPVVVVSRDVQQDWRSRTDALADQLILGDARLEEVLLKAGIQSARAIIVCTNDDLANLEIALDANRLAPDIAVVLRIYDSQLGERIRRDIDARAVLNAAELAAPAFVAAALGDEVVRAFDVDGSFINIISLEVTNVATGVGSSLGDLAAKLDVTPVSLSRADIEHVPAPSLKTVLEAGDRVTVAATGSALSALQHNAELNYGFSHHHPASFHDRTKRPIWAPIRVDPVGLIRRIWKNASRPLRFAFLALNGLVAISTLVFHFGWHLSWLNAFYFTIATMTTVGFGDISLLSAPPLLKMFGCLLMVGGAALLVVFYSVITDYLVTQRFEQVMGRRQSALEHHIVGYRVALRLHKLGEPVLAVERNPDAQFRSELPPEIPVLIGDASQPLIAEQAGISRARSVLAVTNDDLANLRVAHQAEASNPDVRTVVRLFQSTLANKLSASILGINQSLNPSQAAAATFVACALAPNVLQGFVLSSRLFMLRWLDGSHLPDCVNRSVRSIRDTLGCLVLLRQRMGQAVMEDVRASDTIQEGDRLVVLEEYNTLTDAPDICDILGLSNSTGTSRSSQWSVEEDTELKQELERAVSEIRKQPT